MSNDSKVAEYTDFSSDITLHVGGHSTGADRIKVLDAGSGGLSFEVKTNKDYNNTTTCTLTSLTNGYTLTFSPRKIGQINSSGTSVAKIRVWWD